MQTTRTFDEVTARPDLPAHFKTGQVRRFDNTPRDNPITDHGDFTSVFPDQLMNQMVNCINTGKRC